MKQLYTIDENGIATFPNATIMYALQFVPKMYGMVNQPYKRYVDKTEPEDMKTLDRVFGLTW